MTILTKLPNIGDARRFWYCRVCREATYHNPDGTCKDCGQKTLHIPRDGEPNAKHTHR